MLKIFIVIIIVLGIIYFTFFRREYEGLAVAVDTENNLYCSLMDRNEMKDFYLVKYNNTGKKIWMRKYRHSTIIFTYDRRMADNLLIDQNGDIFAFVSGETYILLKYSPDGKLLWRKDLPSIHTISRKYVNENQEICFYCINDESKLIFAVIDGKGNSKNHTEIEQLDQTKLKDKIVWLATYRGAFLGADEERRVLFEERKAEVVAYHQDGQVLWTLNLSQERPNGVVEKPFPVQVKCNHKGEVMIAGTKGLIKDNRYLHNGSAVFFAKVNPTGKVQWLKELNTGEYDSYGAFTSDEEGNIYGIGRIKFIATRNVYIVKYDAAGKRIWLKRYYAMSPFLFMVMMFALNAVFHFIKRDKGWEGMVIMFSFMAVLNAFFVWSLN